eukprot:scaffold127979_cov60-Phaeocystis_antarctica.AAC.1
MRSLAQTGVHYVRCVKPNPRSAAADFDAPYVAAQLRCAGVLEAIRIARMAYPDRMPHAAFSWRYAVLGPAGWRAAHGAARADGLTRDGCAALLASLLEGSEYAQGTTKVFLHALVLDRLERRRADCLGSYAVAVQRRSRGRAARIALEVRRVAA